MSSDREIRMLNYSCTACGAKCGEQCRTRVGKMCPAHLPRQLLENADWIDAHSPAVLPSEGKNN